MENLLVNAILTTTSNKVDGKFNQEYPTKTAYLTIAEEDKKKAIDFGLTEYTSKEDGNPFFIVKLPKEVSVYWKGVDTPPEKMSGGVDTPNFKTVDGEFLRMNLIKGTNKGNEFFRLQAIQVDDTKDIEEIQAQNPFA